MIENNPTREPNVALDDSQIRELDGLIDQWDSEVPPVDASKTRVFSAQRMKYSAEVQLIKNRWGDLEGIRKSLGLSQRKICQLLFVDPSAWTRWTKQEGSAPPHIYRALSWFLLLQEKTPGMSPYNWLQSVARPQLPAHEIQGIKVKLEGEMMKELEGRFLLKERLLRRLLWANAVVVLVLLVSIGISLYR
jgi:transcriptional regulator with XRE-family HTH domain